MGPFATCVCVVAVLFGLPSLVIPLHMIYLMARLLALVLVGLIVHDFPYGQTLSDIVVIGGMIYILVDFIILLIW